MPNVFSTYQGVHRRDVRKQELQTIVIVKEKCEVYLRDIVHLAVKSPLESTVKNTRKALHFVDFPQFLGVLLRNTHIFAVFRTFLQFLQPNDSMCCPGPAFSAAQKNFNFSGHHPIYSKFMLEPSLY